MKKVFGEDEFVGIYLCSINEGKRRGNELKDGKMGNYKERELIFVKL